MNELVPGISKLSQPYIRSARELEPVAIRPHPELAEPLEEVPKLRKAAREDVASFEPLPERKHLAPRSRIARDKKDLASIRMDTTFSIDRRKVVGLDLVLELLGEKLESRHSAHCVDELVELTCDLEHQHKLRLMGGWVARHGDALLVEGRSQALKRDVQTTCLNIGSWTP